jgi:ATP-dependent helicase HrpA
VLAGLLSQIGRRDRDTRELRGARGSRFMIAPGSALAGKPPEWVMAAELVETNRLWARGVAAIRPEWVESLAGPLLTYTYTDVRWDEHAGRAVCTEKATLYGLPVVAARTIGLARVDPSLARELFVDHALVRREWATRHEFIAANEEFLDEARALGDKLRRADLFDHDEILRAFYEARIGADVVSGRHFDRWWKAARRDDPDLLTLGWDDLARVDGLSFEAADYPDEWRQGPLVLPLTYRFDPDDEHDGVTVHIPLALVDQVEPWDFDWQVPGYREELVVALLDTLPKDVRRSLSPLTATTEAVLRDLRFEERPLVEVLADAVGARAGQPIPPTAFDPLRVPPHLRITFSVTGADGTTVAFGKDLEAVRRLLGPRVRRAVADLFPEVPEWAGGDLPRQVRASLPDGNEVMGYPALLDRGGTVVATVLSRPEVADRVMATGLRRLVLSSVPVGIRGLERSVPDAVRSALLAEPDLTLGSLLRDCIEAAAGSVVDAHGGPTWTGAGMDALVEAARAELRPAAARILAAAGEVVVAAAEVRDLLRRHTAASLTSSVDDAAAHLARLVRPGFVASAGAARIDDVGRYVRGIAARLRKLPEAPRRDKTNMAEVLPLERSYRDLLAALEPAQVTPRVVEAGWLLEELRVSLFAQQLGTRVPVSAPRVRAELDALWAGDLWV